MTCRQIVIRGQYSGKLSPLDLWRRKVWHFSSRVWVCVKEMFTCVGSNADEKCEAAREEDDIYVLHDVSTADDHDDLGDTLDVVDASGVAPGNKSVSDWDIISLDGVRSPEASSATSDSVSESSVTAVSSSTFSTRPREESVTAAARGDTVSRLNMIDGLQLVCGSNAWYYPDPRLNLLSNQTLSTQDQHVSSLVVQLSSPTFSFQLLSSCLGWPVRVCPRDAKPTSILHASPGGLLSTGSRDHCVAMAVNGTKKASLGYPCYGFGQNFHVHESIGDVITIHCARSMKYREGGENFQGSTIRMQKDFPTPLGTSREVLAHMLLTEIKYQVWYDLTRKGISKNRFFTFEVFEEEDGAFVGGDVVDIRSQIN